jgi:hypothetical protein
MSRINGEKARANVAKRRRVANREASRAARDGASATPKPGGRPMAARAARRASQK